MAVYEQVYTPYEGPRTALWSRFSVLPRYAIRDLFKSRLLTGYFVLCFVCPLVAAILIYLHHNVNAIAVLDIAIGNLIPIDNEFFYVILGVEVGFAFVLAIFVGPSLISPDLSNNALPLYLSRPFSRVEYVVGKLSVVVAFLSVVTWIPGLILFALQAYLEGAGWATRNLYIAWAIFAGSLAWILPLALVTLAISAFVKWSLLARAAIFGILIVPSALAVVVNEIFRTHWGDLMSFQAATWAVRIWLFRIESDRSVPGPAALVVLALVSLVCIGLLARKVRAYEVVR